MLGPSILYLLFNRISWLHSTDLQIENKTYFFPETSKWVSTLKLKNKVVEVEEINFSIFFRSAVADL